MKTKILNSIIRLRRDNDYNYDKVKNTFIPANGEICLVDADDGYMKVICGDGVSTYGKLEYVNNILIRGYYYNNAFYKDKNHENIIFNSIDKIYLDLYEYNIYIYDGNSYKNVTNELPCANTEIPGIMKLYNNTGNNTDGTMTQKSITDELNTKISVSIDADNEKIIFKI